MEQRVLSEANSYPVSGESLYIYETSSKLKEFSQSSILCNISAYLIFLDLITEVYLNMWLNPSLNIYSHVFVMV